MSKAEVVRDTAEEVIQTAEALAVEENPTAEETLVVEAPAEEASESAQE